MTEQHAEQPQEESSTFVRPQKQRNWKAIAIRSAILAIITALVCIFLFRPMIINGESMMPTYSSTGFTFAFLPYFKIYQPQRKQIVILKHAGFNTFLLKRIIAFPGDLVEIRKGVVYLNGSPYPEPYVKNGCDWNYSCHEVPKGKIFVLGDNRSMPMNQHMGGMIDQSRLAGVPLW